MALPSSVLFTQEDTDRDLVGPILGKAYLKRIILGHVEDSRTYMKTAMTDEVREAAKRKLAELNRHPDVLDRDYISRVYRDILTEALAP